MMNERKTKTLSLRLIQSNYALWEDREKASGSRASEWVRECCNMAVKMKNSRIRVIESEEDMERLKGMK